MYTGHMDVGTLLLYVIMGTFAFVCLSCAKRVRGSFRISKVMISKRYLAYGVFVLVFACFAAFRRVGENLGGADASNYVDYFIHAWNKDTEIYNLITEPLFRFYCQLFRLLTDSYKLFFFVSYGFIAVCYCVFIEKFSSENNSMIPFLLIIFPYLKALCTLRSSMAVAVFLIALVCMDKNKWVALLLCVATVFIHRMSVAYAVFPVFYLLFDKPLKKMTGWKWGAFVFSLSSLGIIAARLLQLVIIEFEFMQGTDAWYLKKSIGVSLWSRFPMYAAHFCLFACSILFIGRIKPSGKLDKLKMFCTYDMIILPATIVLGFWRANEYLYLARLALWGMMIPKGEETFLQVVQWASSKRQLKFIEKIDKAMRRFIYRISVMAAFLIWLLFRIYSEWDDLKIMPYLLDIF